MSKRRKRKYGFGFSFSWRRALGIQTAKQKIARATGIPTTKGGRQRKVGRLFLGLFGIGKKKKRR